MNSRTRADDTPEPLVDLVGPVILYAALVCLSVLAMRVNGTFAVIWPPNGILLAAMLNLGRIRATQLLAVGVLTVATVNLAAGDAPMVALLLAAANGIELGIAWTMITARQRGVPDLSRPALLGGYLRATLVATTASAVFAAVALTSQARAPFFPTAATWWATDALGLVTFGPIALELLHRRAAAHPPRPSVALRLPIALLIVSGTTTVVLLQERQPLLFLVPPAVLLATWAGGLAGAAASCLVVYGLGFGLAVAGYAPALTAHVLAPLDRAMVLQLLVAVCVLMSLPVAALLADRDRRVAHLDQLANRDPLTGLQNRRGLEDALDAAWRDCALQGRPLSLLMVDIDLFKLYNDRFGHPGGDAALVRVAHTLAGSARRTGEEVGRLGGEEFAIVLPDTDIHGAQHVAELARARIREAHIPHPDAPGGHLTLSIGVATCVPDASAGVHRLIAAADDALYRAKREGRDRVA